MRNGPPSPEDFQRQLMDFMKQFNPMGAASGSQAASPGGGGGGGEEPVEEPDFSFDYKPRDVKTHLDRFVIKQDEAKKVLSVAMCDHYHHVRLAMEGKDQPNYTKQNIILLGPTGVGKTYLVRCIADLMGVPFVKGDATKFSETGYVGGDVEDLVRDLVRKANGDVERAQYGIIFVDEIDKIAVAGQGNTRDVSGRGVQTNLLKLMEETEVPVRSPQDIAGQVQSIMDMHRGGKRASVINTKHILFIVSGAFAGLEKVIERRMKQSRIGFGADAGLLAEGTSALDQVETKDFLEFGFEPEFIGRLPVRVVCHGLEVDDLFQILQSSEGSIIRQYEQTFSAYGIDLVVEEGGLRALAGLAQGEQTGARGLMTACERVLRDFKFELPSTPVRRLVLSEELVQDPKGTLAKVLEKADKLEEKEAHQSVHEFAEAFAREHDLGLKFSDEAADLLVKEAGKEGLTVRGLCERRFKDFQFGLKLIAQNTGQREFTVEEAAVAAPDKVLSDWVVASYRGRGDGEDE